MSSKTVGNKPQAFSKVNGKLTFVSKSPSRARCGSGNCNRIGDWGRHVRSPLLNINRACQTCHKWSEEELKARVETIQSRTFQLRNIAMDALVDLINDIKSARDSGRNDASVTTAQDFQRRAQFYLDFIESENSTGFHAPQEAARILGESINF
jgi:nitrite reductase (cytochrome c-552)